VTNWLPPELPTPKIGAGKCAELNADTGDHVRKWSNDDDRPHPEPRCNAGTIDRDNRPWRQAVDHTTGVIGERQVRRARRRDGQIERGAELPVVAVMVTGPAVPPAVTVVEAIALCISRDRCRSKVAEPDVTVIAPECPAGSGCLPP